jgi:hypothetical protein
VEACKKEKVVKEGKKNFIHGSSIQEVADKEEQI